MSSSLPNHPSLDHLRHQARDLQRAFAAGEASAHDRVRDGWGAVGQPTLKLAQAQCVIAREHGFPSWRKLRETIALRAAITDGEDPLHVWYASGLLAGAAELGLLEFELRRGDGQLVVKGWGEAHSLPDFIRCCPSHDSSGNERKPVPVDLVWERLLRMAELTDSQAANGIIRFSLQGRYPYTHWRAAVSRSVPDRLRFELELDRVETVPPSATTGERPTPGERMAVKIRESAAGPLAPATESALHDVAACYDGTTFHRGTIREIAALLPTASANPAAVVCCAQLAGTFGYHTQSLLAIARIAAACSHPCPELSRLAELAVRRLSGTLDMVRLAAQELASSPTDEDRARIQAEIARLDATAEHATLAEAQARQPAG